MEDYVSHLVNTLGKPVSLEGLKVVVDCANGVRKVAAPAFRAPGCRGDPVHAALNGININENCGSTAMDSLRAAVVEHSADTGSPWTATRTAAWRPTRRAGSSTATRSWRFWRWRYGRPDG